MDKKEAKILGKYAMWREPMINESDSYKDKSYCSCGGCADCGPDKL